MSLALSLVALTALSAHPLAGKRWTLVSISPRGSEVFRPGPTLGKPAFTITGSILTGTTGCSPLKATVDVGNIGKIGNVGKMGDASRANHADNASHGAIRFDHIEGGTSEHCPDHALSLRDDFTGLLGGAERYELGGASLEYLTLWAGRASMTFRCTGP